MSPVRRASASGPREQIAGALMMGYVAFDPEMPHPLVPIAMSSRPPASLTVRVFPAVALLAATLLLGCEKSEQKGQEAGAAASAPLAATGKAGQVQPSELCQQVCRPALALSCGQSAEDCQEACRGMLGIPECGKVMVTALTCMARQPVANWECAADGAAEVKDGVCEAEQAAVADCAVQ